MSALAARMNSANNLVSLREDPEPPVRPQLQPTPQLQHVSL